MNASPANPPGSTPPLTHVLITGASSGIGLELARLFATDGHPLVLVARRADRLAALAETLRRDHEIAVHIVPLDLTATGAVDALVAELAREGLGIRVLVNNAGFGSYGPFVDQDPAVIDDMITLNIAALTRLTRLLLPAMVAGASGHATAPLRPGVMNVASTAAFQPGPLMAAYFATKAFVLHFTEALHEELRGRGVTATAFCPGPTRSEFFSGDPMVPASAFGPDGELKSVARAEYARRDARRMDTAAAARAGYEGYRRGQAIAIPGWQNRMLPWAGRLLPRGLLRRLVRRALATSFI